MCPSAGFRKENSATKFGVIAANATSSSHNVTILPCCRRPLVGINTSRAFMGPVGAGPDC